MRKLFFSGIILIYIILIALLGLSRSELKDSIAETNYQREIFILMLDDL